MTRGIREASFYINKSQSQQCVSLFVNSSFPILNVAVSLNPLKKMQIFQICSQIYTFIFSSVYLLGTIFSGGLMHIWSSLEYLHVFSMWDQMKVNYSVCFHGNDLDHWSGFSCFQTESTELWKIS